MTERFRQAGLGLVEIMIALAIGTFMLGGVLSLVIWVSQARTELDKTSEQIENGRYAVQLLSDDLRLAGFYGASQVAASTYSNPSACTTTLTGLGFTFTDVSGVFNAELPAPVRGFAALPHADAACLDDALGGSEALLLRHVETASVPAASASAGVPYVQLSQCQTDSRPMASNVDASFTAFTLQDKDCGTAAEVWPYTFKTYYLSGCDICAPSDGIPTLKVAELQESGGALTVVRQSLVEGIEDMHFEYGMDLDQDGAPDCYAPDPALDTAPADCPAANWSAVDATNWSNVVTVRVNLLARSIQTSPGWTDTRTYDLGRDTLSGPFNDGFRRQVYSAVVTLPNVSGVRE